MMLIQHHPPRLILFRLLPPNRVYSLITSRQIPPIGLFAEKINPFPVRHTSRTNPLSHVGQRKLHSPSLVTRLPNITAVPTIAIRIDFVLKSQLLGPKLPDRQLLIDRKQVEKESIHETVLHRPTQRVRAIG